MTSYFVHSNLNHDNKSYAIGDTVDLSDEAAKPLLADGVVSTEAPILETAPEAEEPEVAERPQPQVGGKPNVSGEPSIDQVEPQTKQAGADITPKVEEKAQATTKKGTAAKKTVTTPTVDISANL